MQKNEKKNTKRERPKNTQMFPGSTVHADDTGKSGRGKKKDSPSQRKEVGNADPPGKNDCPPQDIKDTDRAKENHKGGEEQTICSANLRTHENQPRPFDPSASSGSPCNAKVRLTD